MNTVANNEISGSLISFFSNKVKLYGGLNLAQGIPGYDTPGKLLDILSGIRQANFHQYAPGTGNNMLLDVINGLYPEKSPSTRVFITSGATEAISLIYTYLYRKINKDFNVMSFSPAYESYIHLPVIFGNQFFSYTMSEDNIFDEEEFERFFTGNKIKLMFLASPGNPYGKTLNKEQIGFLMELASKNDAYLIIDAVYSDLYFSGEKPYYPVESITPNVFYINSFSKKFSITGWRVGYFLMHENHFRDLSYIHDYTGLSSAAPLQQAIAEFLQTKEAGEYVIDLRNKICKNLGFASGILNKNRFKCPEVDGGYFIWARLPENIQDSLQFGLDLYENTKTAVIPGVHFGEEWRNYIRINIARDEKELKEGIKTLVGYSGTY